MPDGLEQLWFDYVTELGMSQVGSPDEPPQRAAPALPRDPGRARLSARLLQQASTAMTPIRQRKRKGKSPAVRKRSKETPPLPAPRLRVGMRPVLQAHIQGRLAADAAAALRTPPHKEPKSAPPPAPPAADSDSSPLEFTDTELALVLQIKAERELTELTVNAAIERARRDGGSCGNFQLGGLSTRAGVQLPMPEPTALLLNKPDSDEPAADSKSEVPFKQSGLWGRRVVPPVQKKKGPAPRDPDENTPPGGVSAVSFKNKAHVGHHGHTQVGLWGRPVVLADITNDDDTPPGGKSAVSFKDTARVVDAQGRRQARLSPFVVSAMETALFEKAKDDGGPGTDPKEETSEAGMARAPAIIDLNSDCDDENNPTRRLAFIDLTQDSP